MSMFPVPQSLKEREKRPRNWFAFFWMMVILYYIPYVLTISIYAICSGGIDHGSDSEKVTLAAAAVPAAIFAIVLWIVAIRNLFHHWWNNKSLG